MILKVEKKRILILRELRVQKHMNWHKRERKADFTIFEHY